MKKIILLVGLLVSAAGSLYGMQKPNRSSHALLSPGHSSYRSEDTLKTELAQLKSMNDAQRAARARAQAIDESAVYFDDKASFLAAIPTDIHGLILPFLVHQKEVYNLEILKQDYSELKKLADANGYMSIVRSAGAQERLTARKIAEKSGAVAPRTLPTPLIFPR